MAGKYYQKKEEMLQRKPGKSYQNLLEKIPKKGRYACN